MILQTSACSQGGHHPTATGIPAEGDEWPKESGDGQTGECMNWVAPQLDSIQDASQACSDGVSSACIARYAQNFGIIRAAHQCRREIFEERERQQRAEQERRYQEQRRNHRHR